MASKDLEIKELKESFSKEKEEMKKEVKVRMHIISNINLEKDVSNLSIYLSNLSSLIAGESAPYERSVVMHSSQLSPATFSTCY